MADSKLRLDFDAPHRTGIAKYMLMHNKRMMWNPITRGLAINHRGKVFEIRMAQNEANIYVLKSDSPDPVTQGNNITYSLTIGNIGPDIAVNVVLTDTLSDLTTYVSATPSQGSCSHSGGVVT